MPPIVKISREMVIEAGFQITDESGIDSVNCRAVAAKLGCSTQPVFSRFPTMDELKLEVFKYACDKIEREILNSKGNLLVKSIDVLVNLARNHENVFKLVYLSDYCSGKTFMETRMGYEANQAILKEMMTVYRLSEEKASDLFERVSLLVHGITTVIATTNMDYSNEKILRMVRETIGY